MEFSKSEENNSYLNINDLIESEYILSEQQIIKIINNIKNLLIKNPNKVVRLWYENSILWIYIDGRKEQKEALRYSSGSIQWNNYRDIIRSHGKLFAKELFKYTEKFWINWLSTLSFNWYGELVKNTFDHADGHSLTILIRQKNWNYYFIYNDCLENEKWMIWRVKDQVNNILTEKEVMQFLLNTGVSSKSIPKTNYWLWLWLICDWLNPQWNINLSIHTDWSRFKIENGRVCSMTKSIFANWVWYITTP